MSDIVMMLRVSESDPVQQEAADYIEHQHASHEAMTQEIERLRADCAKLETAHGQNMREISRLRAEIDALRKALREARVHVVSQNNAEGLLDGFKRKPRPTDDLIARIDAVLADGAQKESDDGR